MLVSSLPLRFNISREVSCPISDAENSDGDSDENINDEDQHQGVSEPPNGIIDELPEGVADLSEDEMKAYRDTWRCD